MKSNILIDLVRLGETQTGWEEDIRHFFANRSFPDPAHLTADLDTIVEFTVWLRRNNIPFAIELDRQYVPVVNVPRHCIVRARVKDTHE